MKTNSNSIQKKILLTTILFTTSIGLIIATFSYVIYQKYLKYSILESTEVNLRFLSESVNRNMDYITQMVKWSQSNSTIADFVEGGYNVSSPLSIDAHKRLTEEYQNNAATEYINRVIIANDSDRFIQCVPTSFSSYLDIIETAKTQPYFEQLLTSTGYDFSVGIIQDPFYKGAGRKIIPIIRPITQKYSSTQRGWIYLEIDARIFTDPLKTYAIADDSSFCVVLNDYTYLYENGSLKEISMSSITTTAPSPNHFTGSFISEQLINDTTSKTFVYYPLNIPGCYLCQSISQKELSIQRTYYYMILLIIFFFVIATGIFIMSILNRTINVPVRMIQNHIDQISNGNFSRDSSIEWNHELGQIGKGINDLAENVNELMETRLSNEKQKRDLEYQVLQNQINPHFLYNTLNSIKWMATIQNATGIGEMTTALSRLLKSISKGTKLLISIREELNLVNDYFTIQQYRYGGIISLTIHVDNDSLYDYLIIKFTLQPLVENAIFHGIEPKGSSGSIDIHVFEENDFIKITITDDGVGMSKDLCQSLLLNDKDSSSEFFREIGVSNVHKRLKYEFGEEFGIQIKSELGNYTTMIITLPKRKTED